MLNLHQTPKISLILSEVTMLSSEIALLSKFRVTLGTVEISLAEGWGPKGPPSPL